MSDTSKLGTVPEMAIEILRISFGEMRDGT